MMSERWRFCRLPIGSTGVIGSDWSGCTQGATTGKDRAAVMYACSDFSARSSRSHGGMLRISAKVRLSSTKTAKAR